MKEQTLGDLTTAELDAIRDAPETTGGQVMDPLTLTEIDEIASRVNHSHVTGSWFATIPTAEALRLIATARASIPRPIADAPRDGAEVDLFFEDGTRITNAKWCSGNWCYVFHGVAGWPEWVSINGVPVSFLPIPKGGAS